MTTNGDDDDAAIRNDGLDTIQSGGLYPSHSGDPGRHDDPNRDRGHARVHPSLE
jgi:hypothetical protein